MKPERFVIDTSVIISAACFAGSKPAQVFLYARQHGIILASHAILHEWHSVLRRSKFDPYLSLGTRERFYDQLSLAVTLVDIVEQVQICRDEKDNMFLELAASGPADYLITGDADLLALHPYRTTAILTSDQYLKLVSTE